MKYQKEKESDMKRFVCTICKDKETGKNNSCILEVDEKVRPHVCPYDKNYKPRWMDI